MVDSVSYVFGAHRLEPARQRLLAHGQPLKLGGRAFDLLVVLAERAGRTVPKDELLDLVWPRRVVEENNLQVQVVALRKLLGNEAIATVPGRGYRFTPAVTLQGDAAATPPMPMPVPVPVPAPPAAPPLLGREADLAAVQAMLAEGPLVTLAGSAGIGKTRLAQAALALQPGGGVWVELGPLGSCDGVAGAVARALGVAGDTHAPDAVAAALAATPRLLVLDNAEHVLPGVVALLQPLLARLPAAHVLVTSQEVLHLPQEQVMRLAPLALPDAPGLDAARASGAVALFAARARAADRRFVLDDASVDAVVEICRRLDGIPLAIELAAARVPLLGAAGVRARLDDRLRLFGAGARGALPRQQTLRAALEWSHGLLDEPARAVLRRLAVFVGGFTLEAAQQVAADGQLDPWAVLDQLGVLVDKSLVLAEGADAPRYRLLESTRLFALERLDEAGEVAACRRLHALATADAVRRTRQDHPSLGPALLAALGAEVDNARAALQWAGAHADAGLGLPLVTELSFVFSAANLHAEFLAAVRPWLAHAEADTADPAVAAALLRRVAAVGKNAAHALSLRAALRSIELMRAGHGSARELHEALVVAVAVGARRGAELPYDAWLAEARALQQPDWPTAPRANWHWARERWLARAGRLAEAASSALAQAEALGDLAAVGGPQIALLNAAGFELAQGLVEQAEARARAAVASLQEVQAPPSAIAYGHGLVAACEAQRGAWTDALASCRRARPGLEIEGDDELLLPVLALCAVGLGRASAAARVAGCLDAGRARSGWVPDPTEAAQRQRLQALLAAALDADTLQAQLEAGARLSRAQALALGFDER